ncbi:MAG: hypothetical protein ACK5TR_01395 [Alphaproteobacteria bacterium]
MSEINTLHKNLESGPVVITGRSGVGKSAFAAHYARHFHDRYKVIWTLKADQSVEEQMDDFALKLHETFGKKAPLTLKKKGDGRTYVKDLLRTAAFSWLLILDNAPSYAAITDNLPETHGAKDKHVIVTSLSERDGLGILRLTSLTDAEALAFLQHYLKDARSEDLEALAATLENHPLALLQAAAYINATPGMGVPAYISFFTENKKAYWASESKALGDQPLLYTAIKMSTEKIKASNPDDYTLLVALSLLDTTHLDKTLIEKMYINLTKGDMGGFGRLLDVALIAPEGNAGYRIHDYVRSVIIATAPPEVLQQAATLSATVFLSLFPEKIEEGVGVFEKDKDLMPHLKKLMERLDLINPQIAAEVGIRTLYYAEVVARDYEFSVPFSKKFKTLFDAGVVTDPFLTGTFFSWYGDAILTGGSVDESLKAFKRAHEAFQKVDLEKSRYQQVFLLSDNLGFYTHWKGDIETSQKYLNDARTLSKGLNDLILRASLDELEVVLEQDRGNFENAIKILDKLTAVLETDASANKVAGAFVKSLKACSLLKIAGHKDALKQAEEALSLRKQALHISQDAYKHALEVSDHKEDVDLVARTLVYLSQAQSALGAFKDAEESARKSIKTLVKHYQGTQVTRRQGVAHMALGDALMGQKRPKEALAEYMIAEEVFNKISSHKAFDDMSELYAKIVNAAIILKEAMVAREYALRHLETFPKSHDRFVDIAIQMKKAGYYR